MEDSMYIITVKQVAPYMSDYSFAEFNYNNFTSQRLDQPIKQSVTKYDNKSQQIVTDYGKTITFAAGDKTTKDIIDAMENSITWYANNTVLGMLLVKLMNKATNQLTIGDYQNRQNVVKFMGIPVRRSDLLLENESAVS